MTGKELRIGIIGAGKAGTALALSLSQAGYVVTAISSRSPASAYRLADRLPSAIAFDTYYGVVSAADLIFITTPDADIEQVASSITVRPDTMFCHISAATPIDVLNPFREQGALTGVFHPLQAIGSLLDATILPGITFAIEAEGRLIDVLKEMASKLSCRTVELTGSDRVLYHASAVMASNYLVTLINLAAGMWQGFETKERAIRALLPLVRGTLDNIENIGIPDCLTGPISRGDTITIKRHLAALVESAPRALDAYRMLGIETIPLAIAKGGIDQAKGAELISILEK